MNARAAPGHRGKSRLQPALLTFGLAYVALWAAATVLVSAFNFNGSGGLSIGVLIAAIWLGARSFVLSNRRAMIRAEQLRFALLGLAILVLVVLLQASVVVPLSAGRAELPRLGIEVRTWIAENTGFFAIVVAIAMLLHFAILYLTAGWFSQILARRLATTGRT